ncbi:glucosamine-6-phosphate deaminase [Bacillus alkalicellulosilyticus]|uniref:glucosamine-6-phosphate deaminase n=1 Tax=Alkalihalobacterium alkalicellulosilyticum TaxID=1912214 RepID=UPI0009982E2C|nr:glucosamine-6-phosphate deaminase [Bacillus alkalicellulosilyticus]
MKVLIAEDYNEMSKKASDILFHAIVTNKKVVLGLATGGTPITTYDLLVESIKASKQSLTHVHTINLDEYVGLQSDCRHSYHRFMEEHLFQHISIPTNQTHLPNGATTDLHIECQRYEELIASHGGIDLQLLGIGKNGHIGFNEPGTSFLTNTHIVNLTPSTIKANARFFSSIDEVPKQAITMGISTIMKSKCILLLASGKSKATAIKELLEGQITEKCPATILQKHPDLIVVADKDALSEVKEDTLEKLGKVQNELFFTKTTFS